MICRMCLHTFSFLVLFPAKSHSRTRVGETIADFRKKKM